MISMLKEWPGQVQINGVVYDSVNQFISLNKPLSGDIHIFLRTNTKTTVKTDSTQTEEEQKQVTQYRVTVKAYMTKKSEPGFDFMAKWNNDNPMPLRTMVGTIDKQTPGMYHMKLKGEGIPVVRCMRCGRPLSNPVSRHYGIGPECMSKLGIVADIEDIENIKEQLAEVNWEGWVIKSAITEMEEV